MVKMNRYEMCWSQADYAWMVVYAHDLREAEEKFEDGDYVLEGEDDWCNEVEGECARMDW